LALGHGLAEEGFGEKVAEIRQSGSQNSPALICKQGLGCLRARKEGIRKWRGFLLK
jgi:hypothetical protein